MIENKICTKCKEEKPFSEFHNKSNGRYGLNAWCKDCIYTKQKLRWKDRKRKAIFLLGGCCQRCGYDRNMAALHFHHLRDKEFHWNKLRLMRWSSIIEELKKCILLCANCHAEEHAPDWNLNLDDTGHSNSSLNPQMVKPTGKCPVCGTDVYGTLCCSDKCSKFSRRKVKRPRKKTLEQKISFMSWRDIGREYGVSDNAVRKWAKGYGLI